MDMTQFTPNEYVIIGFASFWELIAVGIISAALYFWIKERRDAKRQPSRQDRRRVQARKVASR